MFTAAWKQFETILAVKTAPVRGFDTSHFRLYDGTYDLMWIPRYLCVFVPPKRINSARFAPLVA
ncbi:hypothetical protein Hypma_004213 [Hypsizygus marmoreus]|uniref:Uncharacterized protein n=1 Tax=Hypsizygus marmoreus TaxID=39966 RepID=A0A369J7J9_HYPMA|nr:hypothetical protein Hypma_004213 [Hypsizygus marmoreus]